MTTTYQEPNALGRATLQPSRAKSAVRTAIHLLSYYFILKRRRAAQTRVAGFRLIVPPTVFHPRYFLTSAFFAQFVSKLDLSGKKSPTWGRDRASLRSRPRRREGQPYSHSTSTQTPRRPQPKTHTLTALVVQSARWAQTCCRPLCRARCLMLFCQVLPRSPANPATWPTALGPLVQTIGISRCCSLRLGKGSRPMAACTCSSPRIPISTYSEPLLAAQALSRVLVAQRSILIESFLIYKLTIKV